MTRNYFLEEKKNSPDKEFAEDLLCVFQVFFFILFYNGKRQIYIVREIVLLEPRHLFSFLFFLLFLFTVHKDL